MDFEITRLSSKGQVVIPFELRKGFKEGEKLVVIRNGEQLILKKVNSFNKNLKKDLEFARRTEEAYNRIEAGEGIEMDFDDFIKKMKKW